MGLAWLPNAITIGRMLLAAPLAWLILEASYGPALVVALLAGASDAVDGWLAKRFAWESWLGGVLDPVADKLMLLAAFATLTVQGEIPTWLFVLVVARDLVIVAGAVAYHNLVVKLDAKPTRLSKATTFAQILYVLALLVHLTPPLDFPAPMIATAMWTVAIVTVASGVDYVVRWSLKARDVRRAARLAPRA